MSSGFHGYLAKLRVHRYSVLSFNQNTEDRFQREEKEELLSYVSESWYRKCHSIQNMVKFIAGVGVRGRETCSFTSMLYQSSDVNHRVCPKRKSGGKFTQELKALRKDLKMLKSRMKEQDVMTTTDFAETIHEMIMKNLVSVNGENDDFGVKWSQ